MKTSRKYWCYFFFTLALLASSCIEPFSPVINSIPENLLVVEGFLNATEKTAHIRLTRSFRLDSMKAPASESGALVFIEEEGGTTFPLGEEVASDYSATNLTLDLVKRYRLNIQTKDGKSYQSEFITLHTTPPIDSVTWKPDGTGLTIFANAHDDTENQSHYYSWDFTETWQYEAPYKSYFIHQFGIVREREYFEYINVCWNSAGAKEILTSSTKQLKKDIVTDFPLLRLPKGTEKLAIRYSVLVKQRKISEDEYNYWQILKKTTQNTGGLFDPLPARVTGNIVGTSDPSEPVLGFFSGGTTEEKRIFIIPYELPNNLRVFNAPLQCSVDTMATAAVLEYPGQLYIINSYGGFLEPDGYLITMKDCIDCRTKGGVSTKPDFW